MMLNFGLQGSRWFSLTKFLNLSKKDADTEPSEQKRKVNESHFHELNVHYIYNNLRHHNNLLWKHLNLGKPLQDGLKVTRIKTGAIHTKQWADMNITKL